jgi:hypothetical protein
MGRGRAKAKQVKVARQLKYNSGGTDLDRLRAELGVGTENSYDSDNDGYDADSEDDDTESDDDSDEIWGQKPGRLAARSGRVIDGTPRLIGAACWTIHA